MQKQTITIAPDIHVSVAEESWLDLEQLARVELSSEDEAYPFELALNSTVAEGWRAAQPGKQKIRIIFFEPQNIQRIQLVFRETELERSQEFLLRWLTEGGETDQEIIRQQYNFSPPHTIEETEDYTVNLVGLKELELSINPDKSGKDAFASLAQIRLQ